MTKYIEELISGDSFSKDSVFYVLTNDFKKNGDRLAISLKDGCCRWFEASTIVENNQLYIMDKDNNIIPIKTTEKKDANLEI
jgi:hypothetical protein